MDVVLTLDEFIKLKESDSKLQLFIDSLNHELELKEQEIYISQKYKSEDIVNKLRYEYYGMKFVKDIINITMSD